MGYEINKNKKYKLLFGQDSIIGTYNCVFNKPSMFLYKVAKEIEGFALRKKRWLEI